MQYQDNPIQTYGPDRPTDKEKRREREKTQRYEIEVLEI